MAEGLRNRLRELIDEKPSALGTFITLGDPVAVELAGLAGFDFVVIECEHAGLSLETVQNHLRAARARGLGTLVRVPAQRQVEELPRPGAAAIFEHVYETLPPRLQQQRAEALDDARPI